MSQYNRHRIFSLDEVLPFVATSNETNRLAKELGWHEIRSMSKRDFEGHTVQMNSSRYQVFLEKGTICSSCGIEGKYFALEQDKYMPNQGSNAYHFNLYALDGDGNEVLMTKDHIVPKSCGGSNELSNYQTMCSPCNGNKGSDHVQT